MSIHPPALPQKLLQLGAPHFRDQGDSYSGDHLSPRRGWPLPWHSCQGGGHAQPGDDSGKCLNCLNLCFVFVVQHET